VKIICNGDIDMEPVKAWYHSRTIWASIVTVAAAGAALLGLPVGAAEQAMLADTILQLVTAIGGLAAIFGRVVAKSRIG
jgi:lysylphosphatidylglycerol synthetase-like protein (DUF2156 family)